MVNEALVILSKFEKRNFFFLWEFYYHARKLGLSVKRSRKALAWLFRNEYVRWLDPYRVIEILKFPKISENIQIKKYNPLETDSSLDNYI